MSAYLENYIIEKWVIFSLVEKKNSNSNIQIIVK